MGIFKRQKPQDSRESHNNRNSPHCLDGREIPQSWPSSLVLEHHPISDRHVGKGCLSLCSFLPDATKSPGFKPSDSLCSLCLQLEPHYFYPSSALLSDRYFTSTPTPGCAPVFLLTLVPGVSYVRWLPEAPEYSAPSPLLYLALALPVYCL